MQLPKSDLRIKRLNPLTVEWTARDGEIKGEMNWWLRYKSWLYVLILIHYLSLKKWFKSFFINHKKRLLMYKELLGGSTQTKDTYRFQQRELDLVSLLY